MGEKLLVAKGCALLPAVQGKFEVIEKLLVNMLGSEQLQYFYGWLQTGIRGLYKDEKRLYGQALVFCGPVDCGKSLVQNQIITPLLGGRSGRPISWLSNTTQFKLRNNPRYSKRVSYKHTGEQRIYILKFAE